MIYIDLYYRVRDLQKCRTPRSIDSQQTWPQLIVEYIWSLLSNEAA